MTHSQSKESLTLEEIAVLIGGRLHGDGRTSVQGVRSPSEAAVGDLAVLSESRYAADVPDSDASALLVSEEMDAELDDERPRVVVPEVRLALAELLDRLAPADPLVPGVHPTAIVAESAELGGDVQIGPYAVIEDGAVLGERVRVGPHAVVGREARVGNDSRLFPHAVVYPRAELGERVVLHAGARVGVDGFGYVPTDEGARKLAHLGRCVIGDDVEIGANTCVDRGSLDRTEIESGVKLDNLVHIAHNVRVGAHTMMAALVGIAGSSRIGKGTLWGGQSGCIDHQVVGDGARMAAKTGVSHHIPPGQTVMSFPSREQREHLRALSGLYRLDELRKRVRALERSSGAADDA